MEVENQKKFELTDEQKEIVEFFGSPLCVLAGPGTGKTHSLVERVKFLINQRKIPHDQITIVTFTNAAAGELRDRLEKSGIGGDKLPFVGTLHGLAMSILKQHQHLAGLRKGFRPIDGIFTRIMINDVTQELQQKNIGLKPIDVRLFRRAHLQERAEAGDSEDIGSDSIKKRILREFSKAFHEHLEFYNAVDWNDILHKVLELIHDHEVIRNEAYKHTKYLLVDEYQDLSPLEQRFIDSITGDPNGICVVGDDDQSIYETFRFAAPLGIIEFQNKYSNAKSLNITLCRRCPPVVIEHALSLIKNNIKRAKKELKPFNVNKKGFVVSLEHKSKKTEIEWLVKRVKKILEKYKPEEILILFTDGDIAKDYIYALQKEDIPLNIKLKISHIFESEHFIGLISAIRWYIHNDDNFSSRHCMDYWKGIGSETARQLRMLSIAGKTNLWEVIKNISANLDTFKKTIRQRKVVASFSNFLEELLKTKTPAQFLDIFFKQHLVSKTDKGCEILAGYVASFNEIENEVMWSEILESFEQKMNSGELENESQQEESGVRIMTMHSAKGCESPIVIIPALEDDVMPGFSSNEEEKRRLFYVSLTRAKVGLFLSWAYQRSGQEIHKVYGRKIFGKKKSRFLTEIGK